jgi:branched-subunit amino acid transport protein
MITLTIFAMAVIVFSSRYVFLEPRLPLKLNPNVLHFLSYSAPAVLTAILAPIVFIHDEKLDISFGNNDLICAVVAVILAVTTRNTLLTTLLSMSLFFILRY